MGLSHRESGGLRVATWCGPKSPPRLRDLTAPQKKITGHQRARSRKPAQARFQSAWKTVVFSYQEEDKLRESVVFQSLS